MTQSQIPQKRKGRGTSKKVDLCLLFVLGCLLAFGMAVLVSCTGYMDAKEHPASPFYTVSRQAVFLAAALGVMAAVSRIDYHKLIKLSRVMYPAAIGLGILVLFFGKEVNGQKRWFAVGPVSFQPAEFAKLAVIVLLSFVISGRMKKITTLKQMFLVMVWILPIVGLVGTNNLSTAIIIMGIAVCLIFTASPGYGHFLLLGGLGIGFLGVFLSVESYRLERLAIWRNPEAYEKGYQTMQGLYAIGSGGLFGTGYGASLQKLGFVPEAQNDMIFSIVCEEFGLVGAVLLIGLFLLLVWRLLMIALHVPDLSGCLLAAGIMGHILIQVILNIAVVTNTIPNTGITLPFVSYGGTSVLFLLAEMGLALSVSRNVRQEP